MADADEIPRIPPYPQIRSDQSPADHTHEVQDWITRMNLTIDALNQRIAAEQTKEKK